MGLDTYRNDLGSQQANYAYWEQGIYILRFFSWENFLDRGWMVGGNTYKRIPKNWCKDKNCLLSRKKWA